MEAISIILAVVALWIAAMAAIRLVVALCIVAAVFSLFPGWLLALILVGVAVASYVREEAAAEGEYTIILPHRSKGLDSSS